MSICIIDTSVFCNIINVPNRSQHRERVLNRLEVLLEDDTTLLLPLATIYETGNHIAQNGDGQQRRDAANRFSREVIKALNGDNPFTPTDINEEAEIKQWVNKFPDYAESEIEFGDMSIIEAYEDQCDRHPSRPVFIWSIDSDLSSYQRPAQE